MSRNFRISKRIGTFKFDRRAILGLLAIGTLLAAWSFLQENPQHNPWAPLDLRDPPGWATESKLLAIRGDVEQCRAILKRSGVESQALAPQVGGEAACARPDRTVLNKFPFAGRKPPTTCPLAAGMVVWMTQSIQPAAQEIFGSTVTGIQHLGAYSCRRLYGRDSGAWSEHATGNAIDIAGFTLADETQISLLRDWEGGTDKALFLKRIRDEACPIFGTVLSPDYNAAHRDHFHIDQANRNWGLCR